MAKFRLNQKLNPKNYKITDDISNISNWKARIISNNSGSDDKKVGDWEEVGYVWISLVDNTIIPIARSDEHHQGFDCIAYDLHIGASDYYPVFLGGDFYTDGENNQYPYNEKEAGQLKVALLKLQFFGRNLDTINVNLHYTLHDWNAKPITATQFVEGKYGKEKYADAELTPLGERLIKTLEQLTNVYLAFQNGNKNSNDLFSVVNNLYDVCEDIKLPSGNKIFNTVILEDIYTQISNYEKGERNYLENSLFGFGGIRNVIHNSLRRAVDDDNLNRQLGNVSKIVEMIASI